MTAFSFDLVTPERVLWSGEAEAVSLRTDVGEITFLANHSPFVGALDITVLRIDPSVGTSTSASTASGDGEAGTGASAAESGSADEVRAAVHGGFVHVDENKVVIAAPVAELASEIDVARARRAFETATERVAAEAEDAPAPAEATGDDDTEAEAPAPRGGGAFFDPASADAALRRARVRLGAAGEPVD